MDKLRLDERWEKWRAELADLERQRQDLVRRMPPLVEEDGTSVRPVRLPGGDPMETVPSLSGVPGAGRAMTTRESLDRFGTCTFSSNIVELFVRYDRGQVDLGAWANFVPEAYREQVAALLPAINPALNREFSGRPYDSQSKRLLAEEVSRHLSLLDPVAPGWPHDGV